MFLAVAGQVGETVLDVNQLRDNQQQILVFMNKQAEILYDMSQQRKTERCVCPGATKYVCPGWTRCVCSREESSEETSGATRYVCLGGTKCVCPGEKCPQECSGATRYMCPLKESDEESSGATK